MINATQLAARRPTAKLDDVLKLALDELRMQMLGVQVLFGFQLQGLFQEGFAHLSPLARALDALGIALLIVVLGALLAAPSQHRWIEGGAADVRILRLAQRFATAALLPFAAAIGCALYVALEWPFGARLALISAGSAFVLATLAWHGLGFVLQRPRRSSEQPMNEEPTPLLMQIDQMLTEARVTLPGAQALLGFQLIVTMTSAFTQLPRLAQLMHVAALVCVVLAVILLIAPAAVHRIAYGGGDDARMLRVGSRLIAIALAPLGLGISADVFVAAVRLSAADGVAWACALAALLYLATLWYLLPILAARRKHRAPPNR